MQLKEALALKEQWGDKPCKHPHVVKEYALGTATGDYICTTCGEAGWGRNWNKENCTEEQNNN